MDHNKTSRAKRARTFTSVAATCRGGGGGRVRGGLAKDTRVSLSNTWHTWHARAAAQRLLFVQLLCFRIRLFCSVGQTPGWITQRSHYIVRWCALFYSENKKPSPLLDGQWILPIMEYFPMAYYQYYQRGVLELYPRAR